MSNFTLIIKGTYKITFKNDKVIKLMMSWGNKKKEFPITYFIPGINDITNLIFELEGQEVEVTCGQGYLSKYKNRSEQWITEVTCVLEELTVYSEDALF